MTIFGFNTDIRYGDTVYHVQTEAREAELLLQSAVFVRGRCIGKHGVSYAEAAAGPEFSEEYIHGLLTGQHRLVVNSIREGNIDAILGSAAGDAKPKKQVVTTAPSTSPMADLATSLDPDTLCSAGSDERGAVIEAKCPEKPTVAVGLQLEWLNTQSFCTGSQVRLRFSVKCDASVVPGARIVGRLDIEGINPAYARSLSDSDGSAELIFALEAPEQFAANVLTVLVQATHAGHSARRKFRLRRA